MGQQHFQTHSRVERSCRIYQAGWATKDAPTALLPDTLTLAKEWLQPETPGYKKIWT